MRKVNSIVVAALTACVLALFASLAFGQGGPPMITDDPYTPGDGKWEIETAMILTRVGSKKTFSAPDLDFNYGWGDHIQLKLEVPLLVVDNKDNPDRGQHVGWGDTLLGFKWRFLDEGKDGVAMSFYPQAIFRTPPWVSRRGVVEGETNVFLPMEVGKKIGPFSVAGELGYELIQHSKDQWMYGVVASYELIKGIEWLGEFRGNFDQDGRRSDLILNMGGRIDLTEHIEFIFSAGRSLRTSSQSPGFLMYAGLEFKL